MKKIYFRKVCLSLFAAVLMPALASAQDGKATIAVSSITPTPSLDASVRPDKKLELGRIIESMNSQLIDPDTKEPLGREEVKVGAVKITQVNPKTSTAEILDDTGINTGAVLRKTPQP